MAPPLATLAFYCLEPKAAYGFAAWSLLDGYLKSAGVDKRSVVCPIFKYSKIIE